MINQKRIAIVLVGPQGALNVGSVARVMMNFGFTDLRIVNPECDHLSKQAKDMAVTALPVLENARVYNDLAEAIAESSMVIGTTRRFGKYRQEYIFPRDVGINCDLLGGNERVSLVFGREDHGLSTAELDRCHIFVTVPTDDALPSMNLAQTVSVCLYELYGYLQKDVINGTKETREPADAEALESMYQHMRRTLTDIGFLHRQNPDHILRSFRRILSRAFPDSREVRILHGLWSKIDWLYGEYKKTSRGKGQDGSIES